MEKIMKRIIYLLINLVLILFLFSSCGQSKMKDGFYTAEMSDYSHGWKEYLCIMVKDGIIVYAEFNAKNQSGYIKAWDNAYMQTMLHAQGTYPNEYTRYYAAELIENQSSSGVDTLTGATSSGNNFIQLTAAAIEQAKQGNTDTVVVEMSKE